ncbi:MAG TPA: hypothetical protein V6D19_12935 [Stenomitos sp.]
MALTPEQIKAIRARDGITAPTASSAPASRTSKFTSAWSAAPASPAPVLPASMGGMTQIGLPGEGKPSKLSSIVGEEVQKAADETVATFDRAEGPIETAAAALTVPLKAAGTAVRTLGRAVAEPLVKITEKVGQPVVDKIEEAVPGFSEEVSNNVTNVMKFLDDNAEVVRSKVGDDVYNATRDAIEVLTAGIGGGAVKQPVKQVLNIAEEVTGTVVKNVDEAVKVATDNVSNLFKPTQDAIDSYVLDKFERGVKPTIKGKGTIGQADAYKDKAVEAVKIIADNKDNLKFIDDAGEEIVGRAPQTMREFAESIDQTKKKVFDEYNALAKQAGEAGGEVDAGSIAKELDAVKNNKSLAVTNPEAIKYADDAQKRLSEFDAAGNFTGYKKFDTEVAQDIIKNYNNSLEAFYKNPTYESASKAAIDAGIANNFRRELDAVIENLTGEEYQALKNQYAALKTIEKDVVHRSNILARQNNKSLLDYTDIFSGGEMVGGILSLNPAMFAKGAAQKGLKEYFKYLNSPNRAVKKMFEKVEVIPKSESIPRIKPNMQAGSANFFDDGFIPEDALKEFLIDELPKSSGNLNMSAETEIGDFIDFLKETKNPTLSEMNKGLELMKLQGKDVESILKLINEPTSYKILRDKLGRFASKK